MIPSYAPKVLQLKERVDAFMREYVYSNESLYYEEIEENTRHGRRWTTPKLMEDLKQRARGAGLWNLFLPQSEHGAGLTNVEYALLAESMGRVPWASEVFNCSAPDTGNMETLERYATAEQKERWLKPLLAGEIRSAFAMTEPDVASSDASNVSMSIKREGDAYVISGRKWWISGAGSSHCEIFIVMGKSNPDADRHVQQSMILVPRNTPGVSVLRPLSVLGYDDAPHGHMEISFDQVRVPVTNILLGEGRGFEIAQGRLGPGRIHHCMRAIGMAERALELMCVRLSTRVAFGNKLSRESVWQERVAEARCMIDQARLLTLRAANAMDTVGNKGAKAEIAMIKVVAPSVACKVLDWSMQAHGAAGLCDDFPLAYAYARARAMRIVDGPDEVHRNALARLEFKKHLPAKGIGAAAAAD
jgi:acyl-CoA dehydrogenase